MKERYITVEIHLGEEEAEKIRKVLGETKQATFSQFAKVATIRRAERLAMRDPMRAKNV
jgi:hypothetical protein